MQISTLAVKSGNGVILKGGKEAVRSCQALVAAIRQGLTNAGVDANAVQLLTTREETRAMLELDGYVDLIIPRGLQCLCAVCSGEYSHPRCWAMRMVFVTCTWILQQT